MSIKKFAVIIGALLGVIVLIVIISSLSGGENSGTRLAQVIQRNLTMKAASDLAQEEAGDFQLRSSAATASIVITSDNTPLSKHFSASFELTPPTANKPIIDELKTIEETAVFDAEYRQLMQEQLQSNIAELSNLAQNAGNANLKAILQSMLQNQTTLLEEFN